MIKTCGVTFKLSFTEWVGIKQAEKEVWALKTECFEITSLKKAKRNLTNELISHAPLFPHANVCRDEII